MLATGKSLPMVSQSSSLIRCDLARMLLSRYLEELRTSPACFSLARRKQRAWGELAQGCSASTKLPEVKMTP